MRLWICPLPTYDRQFNDVYVSLRRPTEILKISFHCISAINTVHLSNFVFIFFFLSNLYDGQWPLYTILHHLLLLQLRYFHTFPNGIVVGVSMHFGASERARDREHQIENDKNTQKKTETKMMKTTK